MSTTDDALARNARPIALELPEGFFDAVEPARFPALTPRFFNARWAARVGLDTLDASAREAHLGRFAPLPANLPQPLALRYHGHQFRSYNPDLGDGRGFLFAQLEDPHDGRILDLGTKGSGTTPYSRGGDGRLTLKGGVREILATEMLEALGVNTSKTLSVFETGEQLQRHDEPSPTRACVLVRLGHSHIRFGTFQRHAFESREDRLAALVEHVVTHHAPSCRREALSDTTLALFDHVLRETARLCAQWLAAGFVHGVLNTDNMNINGESFDYGPWRFLPVLDPNFTAAYFDHSGLYRYGLQPNACLWNLTRLAEALSPLAPMQQLSEALERFEPQIWREVVTAYLARLGVQRRGDEEDEAMVSGVLGFLEQSRTPYQRFFFDWYGGGASASRAAKSAAGERYDSAEFATLRQQLRRYEPLEDVDLNHEYFQGDEPCDMLIDEVEAIWAPIAAEDDWQKLHDKVSRIREMGRALGNAPEKEDASASSAHVLT